MKPILAQLSTLLALTPPLPAQHCPCDRPDDHAPISIMGDHTHAAGGWMLSLRSMFMDMDGMYHGSDAVSSGSVFNVGYTVAPTRMTMEMQMLGVMYAPNDRLTLMAMANHQRIEMDHEIFPGAAPLIALNGGSRYFTTRSDGFGDIKLSGLFSLHHGGNDRLHAGLGLNLPTGSIGERDLVPGPGGHLPRQLPAPMQLGSGTFDLLPSLTYVHQCPSFSWGVQGHGTLRLGENHHGYTLGDRAGLDAWFAWKTSDWLSLSAGIGYLWEDELSGLQSDLSFRPPFAPARLTVPTAFGSNYGGHRIDASVGANLLTTGGPLEGHRLGVELRVPLHQDVNGDRLGTDYTVTAGWQYSF